MDKKISIKHFLNKRIAPQRHGGEEYYPIYTQVTYDRKNTQFKMNLNNYLFNDEQAEYVLNPYSGAMSKGEDNRDLLYQYVSKTISWNETMIERLVRFELELYGEKFSITGFGKRFMYFERNLCFLVKQRLITKFQSTLKDILPFNHYRSLAGMSLGQMFHYLELNAPYAIDRLDKELLKLMPLHTYINALSYISKTPELSQMMEKHDPEVVARMKAEYGNEVPINSMTKNYSSCAVFEWYFGGAKGKLYDVLKDFAAFFGGELTGLEVKAKHGYIPTPSLFEDRFPLKSEQTEAYIGFVEETLKSAYPYKKDGKIKKK